MHDRGQKNPQDATDHGAGAGALSRRSAPEIDGAVQPLFAGVWRSSPTARGGPRRSAMARARTLPTYRAHNEQAMAHAAIAFAKASRGARIMACTTFDRSPARPNMGDGGRGCACEPAAVRCCRADVFPSRRPIRC